MAEKLPDPRDTERLVLAIEAAWLRGDGRGAALLATNATRPELCAALLGACFVLSRMLAKAGEGSYDSAALLAAARLRLRELSGENGA